MGDESLPVGEMFAGVGGFRLGLEGPPSKDWETEFLKFEETGFKVVWSNQWEPGSSKQWASTIYTERFGEEGHDGDDLHNFTKSVEATLQIPQLDLLVGGFPCQDYSVARTKSGELGVHGEKGKLWKPIWQIIRRSHADGTRERPKMVLLENVNRLLNSPANMRGLNFSIILKRLLSMGYDVEWRSINADDYGFPQQRSRVFILAYRTSTHGVKKKHVAPGIFGLKGRGRKNLKPMEWWLFGDSKMSHAKGWETGPFSNFPADFEILTEKSELPLIEELSDKTGPFGNAGYAWTGEIKGENGKRLSRRKLFRSWKVIPIKEKPMTIRDIMVKKGEFDYDESYEVEGSKLGMWEYEKGPKKEFSIRKDDLEKFPKLAVIYQMCKKAKSQEIWDKHQSDFQKVLGTDGSYRYEEGKMSLTDSIDKPSRTVVTAEIGKSASRMRHLIKHDDGTYRTLFPLETERLNMFPDNWTKINDEKGKQIPDSKRGFMMGNALVVGIIQRLREPIRELIRRRSI